MKNQLIRCFLATVFALSVSATMNAQSLGCKAEGESINDVLDSRIGQSSEYSQTITLGVSFLLNEECDSALTYFNAASDIFSNDALSKLIIQLGGAVTAERKSVPVEAVSANDVPSEAAVVTEPPAEEETDATIAEPVEVSPVAVEDPVSVPISESPVKSTADESPAVDEPVITTPSGSVSFTRENLELFQAKGLDKVRRLTEYLGIITQKSTPPSTAISTVESALSLFDGENHTVEVSNVNRPDKSRFPIRTYLNRLRMLNYSRVVIEGASFTYVSNFRKGPDGNYYGVARFRQAFSGYRDNKPVYSDVTTKTVAVVLKPYQKALEGESMENWDVFLGDIFVTQTEKK
ncbi:MAG: hypothetical protein ACKOQ6_03705 [Bacteroidota bacterium]